MRPIWYRLDKPVDAQETPLKPPKNGLRQRLGKKIREHPRLTLYLKKSVDLLNGKLPYSKLSHQDVMRMVKAGVPYMVSDMPVEIQGAIADSLKHMPDYQVLVGDSEIIKHWMKNPIGVRGVTDKTPVKALVEKDGVWGENGAASYRFDDGEDCGFDFLLPQDHEFGFGISYVRPHIIFTDSVKKKNIKGTVYHELYTILNYRITCDMVEHEVEAQLKDGQDLGIETLQTIKDICKGVGTKFEISPQLNNRVKNVYLGQKGSVDHGFGNEAIVTFQAGQALERELGEKDKIKYWAGFNEKPYSKALLLGRIFENDPVKAEGLVSQMAPLSEIGNEASKYQISRIEKKVSIEKNKRQMKETNIGIIPTDGIMAVSWLGSLASAPVFPQYFVFRLGYAAISYLNLKHNEKVIEKQEAPKHPRWEYAKQRLSYLPMDALGLLVSGPAWPVYLIFRGAVEGISYAAHKIGEHKEKARIERALDSQRFQDDMKLYNQLYVGF